MGKDEFHWTNGAGQQADLRIGLIQIWALEYLQIAIYHMVLEISGMTKF